ncbi:ParA family protein [Candidatus Gracilibacteria bacterium]|nr:ParA family protein [Candidatus Gracilibacteria bacterium]
MITRKDLTKIFGVTRNTIYRWFLTHPELQKYETKIYKGKKIFIEYEDDIIDKINNIVFDGKKEFKKEAPVLRKTKIISMVNQKGGVAKTNSVINIGVGLSKLGKKVLLVDMDAQGNLSSGIGIEKNDLTFTIYELLKQEGLGVDVGVDIEDVILSSFGVDIIPSNLRLSIAEAELSGQAGNEMILKDILGEIYGIYDYVIIDCPPSLSMLTYNALCASDTVLVPVQAEQFSLDGLEGLIQVILKVKKRLNSKLDIEGAFLTMIDERTNIHEQISDELFKHFGESVLKTKIHKNIKVSDSNKFKRPLIDYSPKSRAAVDYMDLCKELLERGM